MKDYENKGIAFNLEKMEKFIDYAVKQDERLYQDIPEIQFKNYGFSGNKKLDFLWYKLKKSSNFKNKNIIEINFCLTGFSILSLLQGAKKAINFDISKNVIRANKSISKVFNVSNIFFKTFFNFEEIIKYCNNKKVHILYINLNRLPEINEQNVDNFFCLFQEVYWEVENNNNLLLKLKRVKNNKINKIVETNNFRSIYKICFK